MDQFIDNPEQNVLPSAPVVPPTPAPDPARFAVLNKKLQSGGLTPAETTEFGGLVKAGAAKPGDMSDLPVATKADFDKAKQDYLDKTTNKSLQVAAGVSPNPPISQVGVNPALVGGAGQPGIPSDQPNQMPPSPDEQNPEANAGKPGAAYNGSAIGGGSSPADAQAPAPKLPSPPVTPPSPPPADIHGDAAPSTGTVSTEGDAPTGRPTDVGGISSGDVKAVNNSSGDDLKNKILDIAKKTGVGVLDILQAFAHGKSGDTSTTRLGQQISAETAAKAQKLQQDYMTDLEQKRNTLQEKLQQSTQEFQGTQAEKKEAWDQARTDAQLAWEKENGAATRKNQLDIAGINAEANKKYYEMLYGGGPGGAKVASKIASLTGTGAPSTAAPVAGAAPKVIPTGKGFVNDKGQPVNAQGVPLQGPAF